MNGHPEPPPEGALIESARREAGLSVREAARRAGISEGWWRQVVKGYQSMAGGGHGLVRAPADTLAKMAAVVGVGPERLETEGQRPDAAEILRRQALAPPRRERRLKALEDSDEPGLQPYIQGVLRQVYTAAGIISVFPPGADLPGLERLPELEPVLEQMPAETVFPGSAADATLWDQPLLGAAERVRLVAKVHRMAAGYGNAGERRVSGLAPWHGRGAVRAGRYQAGIR